jgi:hypothetical protein
MTILHITLARIAAALAPRGYPTAPAQEPPAPDPLRDLIPPLSEWPDDAVAWCVGSYGKAYWQMATEGFWTHFPAGPVTLPPGFDWRDSLRFRHQAKE